MAKKLDIFCPQKQKLCKEILSTHGNAMAIQKKTPAFLNNSSKANELTIIYYFEEGLDILSVLAMTWSYERTYSNDCLYLQCNVIYIIFSKLL